MGTSQLSAQTQQPRTFMKTCMFYIGIVLNVLGIFLFFFGISSERWMMMSEGSADVTPERRQKYVSNYGPWTACTHGNRCDHPWVIIRGVDRLTTLVVQSVFVVAAGLYLMVLIIIIIQGLPDFLRPFCLSIEKKMIVEFVVPLAAITGFIAMLMMGELKRQVIGHENQTESPGPGFIMTLCAILLTVVGIMCIIFNQHASRNFRMTVYIQKLRRKRKTFTMKGRRRQGRQKTRLRIGVSDVHIFTIDKADSNRDAGDHNDDKDVSGTATGNNLSCEMDRQGEARAFLAAFEGLETKILEGGDGHAFSPEDSFRNHGVWPVLNQATTSCPRQIIQPWRETTRDSSETVPPARPGCIPVEEISLELVQSMGKEWKKIVQEKTRNRSLFKAPLHEQIKVTLPRSNCQSRVSKKHVDWQSDPDIDRFP